VASLDLHPARTAGLCMVNGAVIGAIPDLGLWLRLDTVVVGGES
jgi:hypothetical protein